MIKAYEERNKFRPYKATTSSPNRQNIEIQILHFFYQTITMEF